MLLLQYWQVEYERNYRHGIGEIKTFRYDLNNNLTTILTKKLHDRLENIYQIAVEFVKIKTDIVQLLDENYLP
ncbi:DUF29 family protein [Nostoc sp.]|uniref:DUF29 family protein n=1 Tax=Nostoc sp. TaxID=1180 RepID=UPI002FFA0CC7